MSEIIKEKQEKFTIVANQIGYKIEQFEIKISLDEKKYILNDLNELITDLETNVWY